MSLPTTEDNGAGEVPSGRALFGRKSRLCEAGDYSRVFDKPDGRASSRHLLILARRNGTGTSRLGLVVAKKHVRKAIARNRVKRVTREFFRLRCQDPGGLDVVILARSGAGELEKKALSSILHAEWSKLVKKINSSHAL